MELPASGFVGLAPPGGDELVGNGYTRQLARFVFTRDHTGVTNAEAIVWPIAFPLRWGEIDRVRLWDAAGHPAGNAALFPHVTIEAHQSVRIKPGALTVLADGPSVGSPYGMRRYGRGRYATWPGLRCVLDGLDIAFDLVDPCEEGVWVEIEGGEAEWVPIVREPGLEWMPVDDTDSAWVPARPCAAGAWEAPGAGASGTWQTVDPCRPGAWSSSQTARRGTWEPRP